MNNPPSPAAGHRKSFNREWYKVWFDSPYYHLLYQYRDELEAKSFIDQLLVTLNPSPGVRVLDLACGRGRYSRYLAEKGFDVTGLDLSVRSIEYARQFERDNLSFYCHDMRLPFRTNYFDYVFNIFTSFGYFESEKDDIKTLKTAAIAMKPAGVFVLDFFNSVFVAKHLTGRQTRVVEDISFDTNKTIEGERVIKTIEFSDAGNDFFFQESVRLFTLPDFERLFAAAGLRITHTYGDYQLSPFNTENSPRLILVARRHDQ